MKKGHSGKRKENQSQKSKGENQKSKEETSPSSFKRHPNALFIILILFIAVSLSFLLFKQSKTTPGAPSALSPSYCDSIDTSPGPSCTICPFYTLCRNQMIVECRGEHLVLENGRCIFEDESLKNSKQISLRLEEVLKKLKGTAECKHNQPTATTPKFSLEMVKKNGLMKGIPLKDWEAYKAKLFSSPFSRIGGISVENKDDLFNEDESKIFLSLDTPESIKTPTCRI